MFTYIITAYQCAKSRMAVVIVLAQRERCSMRCKLSGCLQEHFVKDLVHFVTKIIHENYEIVLAVDINECAVKGILLKELKRIGMVQSFARKFQVASLASHLKESEPIDKVWVTTDLCQYFLKALVPVIIR